MTLRSCTPLLALVLITTHGASAAVSGSVTKYSSRVTFIEDVKKVLSPEVPADLSLALDNPFANPVAPVAAAPKAEEKAPEEAKQPLPRLADDAAVLVVADNLRPSGVSEGNGRALLRLENGRQVARGQVITATIQGQTYEALLEDVTITHFTLRMGAAMVTRSISPGSSDMIRRSPTQPTE